MSEWISWDEAVGVVARHFPAEGAEGLLRAAILRGGVIEVRVTDQGYTTRSPEGRYVSDNPDYPYAAGEERPYFRIEDVDLNTLKAWLKQLSSDRDPATGSGKTDADEAEESGNAEAPGGAVENPDQSYDDGVTYRTGAAGRPTSVHLVKPELLRRADAGELCGTLKQETEHLSQWLAENHPLAAQMKPKTIANNFRTLYSEARKAAPEMK